MSANYHDIFIVARSLIYLLLGSYVAELDLYV